MHRCGKALAATMSLTLMSRAMWPESGNALRHKAKRALPYEFVVINDSTPNAWALPGGKIAVHRGLLTEFQSEAELAAVLGHEVVHAAARHSAKQIQRGMLLQGAAVAAAATANNSDYGSLLMTATGLGFQLVNQKYGRDAERESDQYGMQYMSKRAMHPLPQSTYRKPLCDCLKVGVVIGLAVYLRVIRHPRNVSLTMKPH